MTTTTIDGRCVHVDAEGFLADPDDWDEQLTRTWRTRSGSS
jgi:tRNA 2-thiouridine synthesizing protein E